MSDEEIILLQYVKALREGNVTDNGVVYRSWLAGAHGAGYKLFREPHHTDDDMERAEDYLRRRWDVVELYTASVTPSREPEILSTSPALGP